MTPIKYKSFKGRENMEQTINDFMANSNVAEIVHVSSHTMPGATLSYIDLFYREAAPRKPRAPKPSPQPEETKKNDEV